MTLPIIPDGFCAAFELNLADRPEAVVGDKARVLDKIDENVTRIFVKFEQFKFCESFKYRRARVPPGILRRAGMVTARVTCRLLARRVVPAATEISP
jgi:hypothetical protein